MLRFKGVGGEDVSVRVAGLERALNFSATAWRDVWLVMSLSAAGPAAVFFGVFGPVSRDMSQMLLLGGAAWSAVFWAPQTAGLYRSALNQMSGRDERRHALGLAGLKWGMTEVRLIGLASLMFLLAVLLVIPAAAVLGAVTIALRTQTELGLQTCMRYGAYAALAVFAAYPLIWLRVSLGGPATVAEGRIRLFQTWPLTKGRLTAVAWRTVALMALTPLGAIAALALDPYLRIEPAIGQPYWPLSFAAGGAVAAGLFYGAFVPSMFAGLQTQLYLVWRPKVNGRARAKPVLRVVADVAGGAEATDAAVESADVAPPAPPLEIDMPALVAANELFAAPEDWERTRRQAAAFQIGADRIEWPEEGGLDGSEPMAPPMVAASSRDLATGSGGWTDFEWTVGPCPDEAVDGSSEAAAHAVEPFDYEVHGSGSSVFGPEAASLEDPMLLSHGGPEHWPDPASEPVSDAGASSVDTYAWRYDNPFKLRDLFWLSGAAPQADEEWDAGHHPRARDAVVSEGVSNLPAPVAVAPSAEEAPPPVQVLAFAPPRPFDMAWAELDPQRPANDPSIAAALSEHDMASPPKPVLEPVGPAGHPE